MKKLAGILLVLTMVFALSVPAFALDGGSITINNIGLDGEGNATATYKVYRLLDLGTYDTGSGAYSYTVNEEWEDFFKDSGDPLVPDALDYVKFENGYVLWRDDVSVVGDPVAEFAQMALKFAKDNHITPVKSSETTDAMITGINSETGKPYGTFSGLPLGYYLVDSTMGALCGLTTTNPAASVNVKNAAPTSDKQVQEDSTEQWGGSNSADIGQIVNFRVTISVHAGAENYVLHDKMPAGFEFKQDSANTRGILDIQHVRPDEFSHSVPGDKYELKVEDATADADCDFEIVFSEDMCELLETNDKLVVTYNAMLTRNAQVGDQDDGKANINEAWLTFGEGHETAHDFTETYTYGVDIIKTDSQNTLIDGAEFKIYNAAAGGSEVAVVLMDDGVTYRRARTDEPGTAIVVKDGQVRVVGFDNGTYYLEETKYPTGYHELEGRQRFIISDANVYAIFNGSIYSSGSGIHVINRTGAMLPETGGMGTVLFITFGMLVVLGTGVLLVTKKRMAMIED